MMKTFALCSFAFVANCGLTDTSHDVDVAEHNTFGVVTLQAERFDDGGTNVFELRGLDAGGDVRALVRRRIGVVSDLSDYLPGPDSIGSEITISVGDAQTRMVTRELELVRLPPSNDPAIEEFLGLTAVSTALERNAIVVSSLDPAASAPDESEFTVGTCVASQLNTSPLAKQCCFTSSTTYYTRLVTNPGTSVYRLYNSSGLTCKASDGVSACSGQACYYGPNRFARPIVTTNSGYVLHTSVGTLPNNVCNASWYPTPQTPIYPNVSGSFPTGQGCPGGATGAGQWDY